MCCIIAGAGLHMSPAFAQSGTLSVHDETRVMGVLANTTATVTGRAELRLTGSGDPFPGSVVHLNSSDAWLVLSEVRPFTFQGSFLQRVRVNGAPADPAVNVRLVQHGLGTAVVPHGPAVRPLTIHTERRFGGQSLDLPIHAYHTNTSLGALAGNVRSFRLKRGYMATMAVNGDGTGGSRVFVAQDDDLDVTEMPSQPGSAIRFIRVFPWRAVAKKGWAGAGDNPAMVDAAWFYNWNNNENSFLNREYVPIRQTRWWPSYDITNAKQNVTHFLGFNEPDSPEQANMTVAQAIAEWPNLLRSGLRLGSPAPTDGGLAWLYSFMDEADARGYRVDFVAVHFYKGGWNADQLYNWLEQIHLRTGRPLWITEFNNGANWTCCAPASAAQNATIVKSFLDRMDAAPFVERYSIYNWLSGNRELITNGSLNEAGEMYRAHRSPVGYRDTPPQRLAAIYDEGARQNNAVDQEMAYSATGGWTTGIGLELGAALVIPLADFRARLAAAAARGFGGVVDFERGALAGGVTSNGNGFTAMFDNGAKSMDFTNHPGNGGSYSLGSDTGNRVPVSGQRYLARSGTPNFDFTIGNQLGFIRQERVVAVGTTLLGRNGVAGSNFFRFTAWYTNGSTSGSTSTRRQINTNTGSGTADTFAAIAAPPGHWITRVAVNSENGAYTSMDDFAFITSLEPELLWAPGGTIGGSGIWDATAASWTNGEAGMAWPGGRVATFTRPAGAVEVATPAGDVRGLNFDGGGHVFSGPGPITFAGAPRIDVPEGLVTLLVPCAGIFPVKSGAGTLALGAANLFPAAAYEFGGDTRNAGHLRATHPGAFGATTTIRLLGSQSGAVSGIELEGGHTFSHRIETWGRADQGNTGVVLRNRSGNNTWNGDITITGGGGGYGFASEVGRLTLGGTITSAFVHPTFGNRAVSFHGGGEIRITGTLADGAGGANPSLGLAVTKNDSGLLSFATGSALNVRSLVINGGSMSVGAPLAFQAGSMQLNADLPIAVSGEVTFAFPITGTGSPIKSGSGRLVLAAANGFGPVDGRWTLGAGTSNTGFLRLSHPQAQGNHQTIVLASSQNGISGIEVSGGQEFSGTIETVGRANPLAGGHVLRGIAGANVWNGPVRITGSGGGYGFLCDNGSLELRGEISSTIASNEFGPRSLQFGGAGDIIVSGFLRRSGGHTMQDLAVLKTGSGTLHLSGGGNHGGATTVQEGRLRVDGLLEQSAVVVQAGASLAGSGRVASATVRGTLVLEIGKVFTVAGMLDLHGANILVTGFPEGTGPIPLAHHGGLVGSIAGSSGLPPGWRLEIEPGAPGAIRLVRSGFAAWAADHFDGQSPMEDFHGAGVTNLLLYALHYDATRPFVSPVFWRDGTLVFPKRPDAVASGDVEYGVESSPDLSPGSWEPVIPDRNDDREISFRPPAGQESVFLRLRVRLRP